MLISHNTPEIQTAEMEVTCYPLVPHITSVNVIKCNVTKTNVIINLFSPTISGERKLLRSATDLIAQNHHQTERFQPHSEKSFEGHECSAASIESAIGRKDDTLPSDPSLCR